MACFFPGLPGMMPTIALVWERWKTHLCSCSIHWRETGPSLSTLPGRAMVSIFNMTTRIRLSKIPASLISVTRKFFLTQKGNDSTWLWLLVTMLNFLLQIICAAGHTPVNSGLRATIVPASGNVPTSFHWSVKGGRIGCSSSAISGRANPAGPKLNTSSVNSTADPSTAPNRKQPPSGWTLAWTIMRRYLSPVSPFRLSSAGAAIGTMRRVCRRSTTRAK